MKSPERWIKSSFRTKAEKKERKKKKIPGKLSPLLARDVCKPMENLPWCSKSVHPAAAPIETGRGRGQGGTQQGHGCPSLCVHGSKFLPQCYKYRNLKHLRSWAVGHRGQTMKALAVSLPTRKGT